MKENLHFKDSYIYLDNKDTSTSTTIFQWVQKNYGHGNLVLGIFIAFWTKILFRKYDYNFYEILILLCFVMGVGMFLLSVFGLVERLTKLNFLGFGGMSFVAFCIWAMSQFFDKKKNVSCIKALFAYFQGLLTVALFVLLIGHLIDLLILKWIKEIVQY